MNISNNGIALLKQEEGEKLIGYLDTKGIATITRSGNTITVRGVAEGSADVTVITTDGGYTAVTELTYGTDYSVSGAGDASGGTATLNTVFKAQSNDTATEAQEE